MRVGIAVLTLFLFIYLFQFSDKCGNLYNIRAADWGECKYGNICFK